MKYLTLTAAAMVTLLLMQCHSPVVDYTEELLVHQCDILESILSDDWEQCCREQGWECK